MACLAGLHRRSIAVPAEVCRKAGGIPGAAFALHDDFFQPQAHGGLVLNRDRRKFNNRRDLRIVNASGKAWQIGLRSALRRTNARQQTLARFCVGDGACDSAYLNPSG